MSVWVLLTPREHETIAAYRVPDDAIGEHAELLRQIQRKVQTKGLDAEVALTGAEVTRVRAAARNWRLGYERAFKALQAAVDRHV